MKHLYRSVFVLLFLSIVATGCGDDASEIGVTLFGSINSATPVPTPVPASSSYTATYLTPTDIRIALYKAGLLTATDTTPSFILFDRVSASSPIVTSLDATPVSVGSTLNVPPPGTYTKLLIGITYIEFVISQPSLSDMRFRVYLSTVSPVQARDVLIENPLNSGSYSWIDTSTALLSSVRPGSPLQMPSAQLSSSPSNPFTHTFTLSTPLVATAGGNTLFDVAFVAAIKNLFFFDDVDTDGKFNYPPTSGSCTSLPVKDGCQSAVASGTPPPNFFPAYPGFTGSASPTPTP